MFSPRAVKINPRAISSCVKQNTWHGRNFHSAPISANVVASSQQKSWKWGFGLVAAGALAYLWNTQDKEDTFHGAYAASVPVYGVPGTNKERSFIAIKPDGVNRNLIGEIISRFEAKGYKLVGIKILTPSKDFAKQHYDDLKSKPFFPKLVDYFSSGPVVAMVWEGKGVISGGRKLIGATDPNAAEPGSIRGDLCLQIGRNIIHGSDSPDAAKHEISLWFTEKEVSDWTRQGDSWIYE